MPLIRRMKAVGLAQVDEALPLSLSLASTLRCPPRYHTSHLPTSCYWHMEYHHGYEWHVRVNVVRVGVKRI